LLSKKSNPIAIVLNEKDNVATLIAPAELGSEIALRSDDQKASVVAKEFVDAGHKIALRDIQNGDRIIKFGEIIGESTRDISAGSLVHSHNMRSLHGKSSRRVVTVPR
jgi:altronate dehydratase small subunit